MVIDKIGFGSSSFGELEIFRVTQLKHHTRMFVDDYLDPFLSGGIKFA